MRTLVAAGLLLSAGLTGLVSIPALAQVPTATSPTAAADLPRKGGNVIKIAPLGWIHGQLPFTTESRIGYERRLGERSSLGVSYSYLGTNYPFSFIGSFALSAAISSAITASGHPYIGWTNAKIRARGARWQLQYRKYLNKNRLAPEGWYLSPQISYAHVTYQVVLPDWDTQVDIEVKNRNYNLLFGHQRVLGQHLVFDVFTGVGYREKSTFIVSAAGQKLQEMPHGTRFKLSSGLNLGWAF
ncbi:MAG: hypothetical protein H7330_11915 [Hymenobacteraceae bacterium]|nr:hypothetical protein [Hymenobacteraceae bacterium]